MPRRHHLSYLVKDATSQSAATRPPKRERGNNYWMADWSGKLFISYVVGTVCTRSKVPERKRSLKRLSLMTSAKATWSEREMLLHQVMRMDSGLRWKGIIISGEGWMVTTVKMTFGNATIYFSWFHLTLLLRQIFCLSNNCWPTF